MTPLNDTLRHIARQLGDQTYYATIDICLALRTASVDESDNLLKNPPYNLRN